ncbi:HlyD family secretion protein [uncultured Desulfuromonas sp.]|uniref:HlyD family secretion protein n=1 Tax=uncultured Desulfuromonas sp. TaxID=181013 RepID=UPI002AAC0D7D|nr:HlyD family secretion protein [uncultured Desulfuromonas sp.]
MKISPYFGRILFTLAMVACAGVLSLHLWDYYMEAPWTRDGRICVDVVNLSADVSGLVSAVLVQDNQSVHKGDVLFRIDRARFALAFKQTKARVASTQAELEMAQNNLARYQKLLATAAVTRQQLEQVETAYKQATAAYDQACADHDLAAYNLTCTEIKAPVNGIVTNLSLWPGSYVKSGESAMALINTDSFYVAGYFEEIKLERIHIGDAAVISPMGSSLSLDGHVESITYGINDRERDRDSLLVDINPTFSWVRLAQRIPVRIHLDSVPQAVKLVAGRTVSVAIIESSGT